MLAVQLEDGRQVVVKVRQPAARIAGCIAVQRHLFRAGFPCAEPLTEAEPLGDRMASAETYLPGGAEFADAAASAKLLADLVSKAPSPAALPSLEPPPPWVGWGHEGSQTWPLPDDLEVDLNRHPGPDWLDDLGARLRELLNSSAAAPVIGHADWESHNIRWNGERPLAVDDWDSVAALDERALAGAAAAVFPTSADGRVVAADRKQSQTFLAAYRAARNLSWSAADLEVCRAAGLWVLAYNAKKELLGAGGGYLEILQSRGLTGESAG